MATLDLSQNGASINRSYKHLIDSAPSKSSSPTHASWAVFAVSAPLQNAFMQGPPKDSVLKVQTTGEGDLSEMIEEFNDGKVQFAFVKVKDTNTGLAKYVLIGWCGEGVPERVKGYFTGHLNAVSKVLRGYHVQITARSESDLTPDSIIQKVADASGSKYSAASSSTTTSTRPPPPTTSKPAAYKPSTTTGTSRSAAYGYTPSGSTDNDGWGEDAPQVTRSKLENVQSAYKPTKVDIAALKAMPSSTTSGSRAAFEKPEVVRGAYQPVGKVDIAAIRAASRTKEERPEPVRGAYQPVGKVDIAALRAQAKPRSDSPPPEESARPLSVSERTSVFSSPPRAQAERLTSLPKPKPAKMFGTGAPSFGTKPLTPGGFGAIPSTKPAPKVGTANKDFASQGGKTPAQIWAEKKARERGEPLPSSEPIPPPVNKQEPVEQDEPSFSGVSAMKSRFSGAAPMGAQYSGRSGRSVRSATPPPPPSPPQDNRASPASAGVVVMPGFLPRQQQQVQQEVSAPPPPPPAQPPRSPTPPSPPTPEIPGSPVMIAMPVGRGRDDRIEEPHIPAKSLPVEEPAEARGQVAAEEIAQTGITALVVFDYEAMEDNEITLAEGETVTEIDMVDENWWAGKNSHGDYGLFPAQYVEVQEAGQHEAAHAPPPEPVHEPEHVPEPAHHHAPEESAGEVGQTAKSIWEYLAAEDNEISFPADVIIENISFPDADWWEGTYNGDHGLFPANYVELIE